MSRESDLTLALDLGGTNFRLALVDGNGRIRRQYKERSRPENGPQEAIGRITDAAREMVSGAGGAPATAMGIAVAGLVTPDTGVLLTSPNMLSWYNTPLKALFERELQLPVSVGNDANLAALGEHRFGAGRGIDDLIYLTVSTGVGGGVIAGGRLLTGSRGFAGELGHMTIDVNGPACNCGNVGCLEVMASGTAIARLARERLSRGEPSEITGLVSGDAGRITAEVVEAAARKGDALAAEVMLAAAANLGVGVVNLVHIFNPALVIIGGGVSKAGDLIFEPVRRVVAQRVMKDIEVSIVPASLGDDCGLLGAAALASGDRP